jgi:hypothetical protein
VFDDRSFFVFQRAVTDEIERSNAVFRQTGALVHWIYPFSFYRRIEVGAGYIWREYDYAQLFIDPFTGESFLDLDPIEDNYPIVQASLVGDSTVFSREGPIGGRRWRLRGSYGHDTDQGGARSTNVDLDLRQYIQVSPRTSIALRLFGGYAGGNLPSPYYIGGTDTVRGVDFRTLSGDRAFFTNIEFRFPLIDVLRGPFLNFSGIRGRVFLDVGGAWRDYLGEDFDLWDDDESRLADAVSSYGWGLTVRFGGLDLNWDFAQQWDFKDSLEGGFRTDFWIGTRF